MTMEQQEFKYFAFISYSSHDMAWGKRVQHKLESYRMPATLCSEHGWERTPMNPVFFAPYDIQPGGLTEELQQRLRASRNLIVIGSPNSAQSLWVGKEIEFFHNLGRTKHIHYFIVDGKPNSGDAATECYNPILKELGIPEILGANIHEKIHRWPWLNKERAYVQLISKLLGVEFNDIWQRHKRLLVRQAVAYAMAIMTVLAALVGVWYRSQPVDVVMRFNEASAHNNRLPALKDAVVTITLDNETKTDTIHTLEGYTTFANIPRKYVGRQVRVEVRCENYLSLDTTLILDKNNTLDIRRDPSAYGDVHFTLWNPQKEFPIPNVKVMIAGHETYSDDSGSVRLFIPLEQQDTTYSVQSDEITIEDPVFRMLHGDYAIRARQR